MLNRILSEVIARFAGSSQGREEGFVPSGLSFGPKRRENKTLSIVLDLPENADPDMLDQALVAILQEIDLATESDMPDVYQSITLLKKQRHIVEVLKEQYLKVPPSAWHERTRILGLLGELRNRDTLEFLKGIVFERLPPSQDTDLLSDREREEIVQSKAVEALAFTRTEAALAETLRVATEHESHAVRLAAIDAYMWNLGDSLEATKRLYEELPSSYHKYIERPRYTADMDPPEFQKSLDSWRKRWEVER